MKPLSHIIWSIFPIIVMWQFFGKDALILLVGSVLIDIDHYFVYIYRFNNYNIIKCYKEHIKMIRNNDFSSMDNSLFVFHNTPFFLLSAMLSLFSTWALLFFIGIITHYILDLYTKIEYKHQQTTCTGN